MLPEESNGLLRKWHTLTPDRRNAVLRLGWDYIDVPIKWTPQNHNQFPADFQQKVAAVALAWQLPLVPFNRKPGDLAQQLAEATGTHALMGLQNYWGPSRTAHATSCNPARHGASVHRGTDKNMTCGARFPMRRGFRSLPGKGKDQPKKACELLTDNQCHS